MDVIEIDAATNRGIDEIRELRDAARYRPARDRYKIWILDEAHQITDAAFNALLKTLEEPPSHVIFMMATTQPEDIPQTIRSRCQHFSFHAVSFDDIVGQLRDIAKQEGIEADDNALALLAEAGDGSMRDALSIMDQAIASCGDTLSADVVRGLVGTVGSDILEVVMDAVARNSSEEVLRTIDRLLVEGQSAQHFARQMVRFLRNTLVAKVAGSDSPLLQISSDERARVSRVADHFSEEDLTRFLQIMLRTHSELGYKQEQRFHLELGLAEAGPCAAPVSARTVAERGSVEGACRADAKWRCAGSMSSAARPAAAPPSRPQSPEPTASRTTAASPFKGPSPFEADRSRKSDPKAEAPEFTAPSAPRVDVAPAIAVSQGRSRDGFRSCRRRGTGAGCYRRQIRRKPLRDAVLRALEEANQQMLAHNLESGEWSLRGNEVTVKVAMSQVMCDVAMGDGPRRIVTEALTKFSGRPMKLKMVSGGAQFAPKPAASSAPRSSNGAGARSRAMNDPVVQRMQEKFGAEIRSVIDHKERG